MFDTGRLLTKHEWKLFQKVLQIYFSNKFLMQQVHAYRESLSFVYRSVRHRKVGSEEKEKV